jgi:ParB/RepB/Spo0J family partition protein
MSERIENIDLKLVHPNRLNPRLVIDTTALHELADSIRQIGIVEPLVLRPKNGEYEVVVGERRYQAAKQVGLTKIPAIVREYSDSEVIELNLIENVHREDLSAVEKGNSIKELMEKYPEKYPSKKSVATRLGLSLHTLDIWLELVSAPKELQMLIAPAEKIGVPRQEGKIDYDTAATILHKIKEPERQIQVAQILSKRPIYRRVARQVINEVSIQPERPVEEIIERVIEAPYELPFRLTHMKLILDGIKTQTSRKGIPDPKVKEGAVVHAAVWEPHFADLLVIKIERKRLGNFTEEDAQKEGGYTLDEFKKVWKDLHREWNSDEMVNIIHFRKVK